MYSLGTVHADDSKGVTVADLSAYDDPDAKFGYELTPTPYSRLAKSINFRHGHHTTRQKPNRDDQRRFRRSYAAAHRGHQ